MRRTCGTPHNQPVRQRRIGRWYGACLIPAWTGVGPRASTARKLHSRGRLKMKDMKKSIISSAACAWALLGLAGASRADEPVGPPPAGEQPSAEQPAAPTSPLIAPSITGPLTIQLPPNRYDMGPLGDIYVDGIGSGLFQW